MCSVACKAYTKGLSPANLQSAFRKSGIYPFNPSAIDSTVFEADQLRKEFQLEQNVHHVQDTPTEVHVANIIGGIMEDVVPSEGESQTQVDSLPVSVLPAIRSDVFNEPASIPECMRPSSDTIIPMNTDAFFKKKRPKFVTPVSKERRSVSKVVAGKAITEADVTARLKQYFSESQPIAKQKTKFQPPVKTPCNSQNTKKKANTERAKSTEIQLCINDSPKASTSGAQRMCVSTDSDTSEVFETTPCCVCGQFSPEALKQLPYVEFTSWAECDYQPCGHWVHLKYCCPLRVIRRNTKFFCPCHGLPWTGIEE
ncbi:MAG: hypothetical protein ABW185_16510 [Sedimenticola sp.]